MQVFVAVSCLLAVASAGLIASPHSVLLQPQHLPIIDSNGVPVEPLVNQAARVQHAELRAAAQIRNGDIGLVGSPLALASPLGLAGVSSVGLAGVSSLGLSGVSPLALSAHGAVLAAPQHLPIIDASGVPVEPLENQIARAQNAVAHINAKARNGDLAILGRKKRGIISPLSPLALSAHGAILAGPQHLPIIDSNGVPVEPLVNQAARVQHAQLRAAAQIRNGDVGLVGAPLALSAVSPLALSAHGAILAQHSPLLDANSVPVEPLANQIARAQNAAAHLEANARNGHLAVLGRKKRGLISPLSPLALSAHGAYLAAPQHLPIIDSNGVPVEPLVNQAARVQHAQLRAAAQIRNGDIGLVGAPLALAAPGQIALAGVSPLGLSAVHGLTSISHAGRVPLDTPDVAAVRAAHLATKVGVAHGLAW